MKVIRKSVIATVSLISALTLSACSNNEGFGLQLNNGDENFITTDLIDVTNQEVFEAMGTSLDQNGLNNGVLALLDLVDRDLLVGNFEIDLEEIDDIIEMYKEMSDFDEFLLAQGYESEEQLVEQFKLLRTREAVAREAIVITDDEIEEAYETLHGSDNEADSEEESNETGDVDNDADEEEVPTLEEVRDEIKEDLIQDKLTAPFVQTELARLRHEAGFVIQDPYLQDQYIAFLEAYDVEPDEVFTTTSSNSNSIVATIDGYEYTSEQLFEELIPNNALASGIALVDPIILSELYEVSDDEVTDLINNSKIQLGDQFYPTASQMGLDTDQEIFDYFKLMELQDVAFVNTYTPSEERLRELYEEYGVGEVSTRHILVEDEEFAKELIEQLEAAEDLEAKFKELAIEHSTCPSAPEGGDLGSFAPGDMVEEFDEAAFALEVGEMTTEPVETIHGFHIIYRYEFEKPSFDELRDELEIQELDDLRTRERIESLLVNYRSDVNFTFTNERIQARYDAIVASIEESLREEDAEPEDEADSEENDNSEDEA